MDAQQVREAVVDEKETALSRLGSSKALYAATGGEMDGDAVLKAAADDAAAAWATFNMWGDEKLQDAVDRQIAVISEQLDDRDLGDYQPATESSLHEYLRDLERPATRTGGLLGWTLVSDRTLGQMVGFFVGEADSATASAFREVREETETVQGQAIETIDVVCESERDWAEAKAAAEKTVQAAYDDYVEILEGMGVDPKNVC